jgi:large subunit ribosomal protein L4
MFKASVFSTEGEKTSDTELPEVLFDGTVHEAAMWQAVKAYLSNQRQGTAATKTRAMVSGGGKKPWRQKGTGRARQGSIRAPHWRGGGNVFGPRADRNFKDDIPKKVRWLARRSAYNARAQDDAIFVIEPLTLDTPKTQAIAGLISKSGAAGNVLILTDGNKPAVYMSTRNIPRVEVRPFGEESAYDLLWADSVLIEAPALERAAEVAHA